MVSDWEVGVVQNLENPRSYNHDWSWINGPFYGKQSLGQVPTKYGKLPEKKAKVSARLLCKCEKLWSHFCDDHVKIAQPRQFRRLYVHCHLSKSNFFYYQIAANNTPAHCSSFYHFVSSQLLARFVSPHETSLYN